MEKVSEKDQEKTHSHTEDQFLLHEERTHNKFQVYLILSGYTLI